MSGEEVAESGFKIPFGTRHAAEKVQAQRTVFGKSVACEMRFSQETKPGNPASSGKLMPLGFPHRPEIHLLNHSAEKILQRRRVTQRLRGAPKGFDDPLDSVHGTPER